MKKTLTFVSAALLLVACTPSPAPTDGTAMSSSAIAETVRVHLTQKITEGEDGIPTNKASIEFSGSIDEVVDLGDVTGELMYVDPKAYATYKGETDDVIAVFSAWFAGGGEEIVVRHYHDTQSIAIEMRSGGEEGECTELELLAEYEITGIASLDTSNLGTPITQSSLAFCTDISVNE